MTVDEASGPVLAVWPDNLAAVNIFIAIGTQWREGFRGPTGLDYNVMYARMALLKLTGDDWLDLEADLRLMEDAALTKMKEKK